LSANRDAQYNEQKQPNLLNTVSKKRKIEFLKPTKVRKQGNQSPMNINLMICPDCGTVYHWGTLGMGNCPTCARKKADSSIPKAKEE